MIIGFAMLTAGFVGLFAAIRYDNDTASLISIITYAVVVQGTITPLYWFHLPEITQGASLSIALSVTYFWTLGFTSIGPYVLKNQIHIT